MLVSPSPLPSLLAYRARIGFQYCQFWPMGREVDFSTVNSGPWDKNWILVLSILAHGMRIDSTEIQFWPSC